jgi:serine/threonine protein kinase
MDTAPMLVSSDRPSTAPTAVRDSLQRASAGARLARAFASPIGVLITLPLLVAAVGIGILLVGRDATRSASEAIARRQLADQARQVDNEVAFALDQAGPLLERLRALADHDRPIEDVLPRLHDLVIGRPGVAYASISFPDGLFRGAYVANQRTEVTQSSVTPQRSEVDRYTVKGGGLVPIRHETNDYDPRKRTFYDVAVRRRGRAWTQPYTFFLSHETGITCTEPVFADNGQLRAVLTVDFDVDVLSTYLARPGIDDARSILYTRDGIILAYPTGKLAQVEGLLSYRDLKEPALEALFTRPEGAGTPGVFELTTPDGDYLTSVAAVGGRRAGVELPLDWFVATLVPERTLFGPTHSLERSSLIASGAALAIAVALALVLAWNLVRMRRQVAASRAEARFAQERAKELGSYRLVAKLGAGGMGEVWRAEHRLLARQAAIKLIRPDALKDTNQNEIRERFRREAQTLATMRSRHTIEIFDYGMTDDGVFYYVMELLDGLDLESLVLRFGPQPPARVIHIMIQACASLAEAHEAGLLHRDIKPPNLFVSRAADELDVVKLLDFGIVQTLAEPSPASSLAIATISLDGSSRAGEKLTRAGAMLGTPGFMAPEQILGMEIDCRADLYALGCVAWWLVAGHEVFQRDRTDVSLLKKHVHDPVPSLRAIIPECPAELERVITACLAKEVDQRPPTARALATWLSNIPILPEDAWDQAAQTVWWNNYQPAQPTAVSPSEVKVIMPERPTGDERPTIRAIR